MRARTSLLAAAAAIFVAGASPVSAAGPTAATFEGVARIGCFGCGSYGPSGNSADIWVTGLVDGGQASARYGVDPSNATATFTVNEPTGAGCLLNGAASGTVTVQTSAGPKSSPFTWQRVGSEATITLSAWGAIAYAHFSVTSPIGNPCGGPVDAYFDGFVCPGGPGAAATTTDRVGA
jgi:hypothetical protein